MKKRSLCLVLSVLLLVVVAGCLLPPGPKTYTVKYMVGEGGYDPDDPDAILTTAQWKDTRIHSATVDAMKNFGAAINFVVRGHQNSTYHSLIYIDVSAIPANAVIESAQLMAYLSLVPHPADPADGEIITYRMLRSWVDGTGDGEVDGAGANWHYADYPAEQWGAPGCQAGTDYDAEPLSTFIIPIEIGKHHLVADLSTAVQNWVNGTWENYGVILTAKPGNTTQLNFVSVEHSNINARPYLEVKYTVP